VIDPFRHLSAPAAYYFTTFGRMKRIEVSLKGPDLLAFRPLHGGWEPLPALKHHFPHRKAGHVTTENLGEIQGKPHSNSWYAKRTDNAGS